MFDIGFWEITLILILALVVLGPERLPGAARTVGQWVGKARRYIEGVKSEVEREFDTGELKRMLHNQEVQIRELQSKLNEGQDYIDQDYHNMFEDKDDPGTDKPASKYDIIEEDDDEFAGLEDSPKKKPLEQTAADEADKTSVTTDSNSESTSDNKQ
jgi:sec-independent protein translocase protein TatB